MAKQIKAPVALGGRVYRAGQEDALASAASAAGVDLAGARFAASLAGEWGTPKAAPKAAPKGEPKGDAPKAAKKTTKK